MVEPMRKALEKDPDFFCGQIIFQKDGYNMAKRTPVAAGLRRQLELLTDAGYRVVTVQELLERHSPFSDVGRDDPDFDAFCALQKTRAVVYSNNTLQPDKPMTAGELAMLLAPRSAAVDDRLAALQAGNRAYRSRYSGAMAWCIRNGLLPQGISERAGVTAELLRPAADRFTELPTGSAPLSRRAVLRAARP